ncbi:MAG: hypothetical protein ACRDUV_16420 [Pseudonocardiaceae bacterium]
MAIRVVPVRVGEVDLLVETVPVAGTEPTSGLDKVCDRIIDAFTAAREAIVEVASSTATGSAGGGVRAVVYGGLLDCATGEFVGRRREQAGQEQHGLVAYRQGDSVCKTHRVQSP